MIPTPEQQLQFLNKLRRLLDEGKFTSTYKYALLVALADLSVEKGIDGKRLEIHVRDIANKFIALYHNHTKPYPGKPGQTIYQNNGKQMEILKTIAFSYPNPERGEVTKIANKIKEMPLWRLQKIRGTADYFLYKKSDADKNTITIDPIATFCFRRFYGIIVSMVKGEWLQWVRSLNKNEAVVGCDKLQEYLFGTNRFNLKPYAPLLREIQDNKCFYCGKGVRANPAVDHFVPWSMYSYDLGHNFVLAHSRCNSSKGKMLPSIGHLKRWVERNQDFNETMKSYFVDKQLHHNLSMSYEITKWAYAKAEDTNSHLWVEKTKTLQATSSWRKIIPEVRQAG